MNSHLAYVDDVSDIRQGDIIRRFPQGDESRPEWGFVVTADCDIANQKARDRYTWLEIVRSVEFLDEYWATDALRRHLETQTRLGCDAINAIIRKSQRDLTEVIPHSLCEWLKESTPEEVLLSLDAETSG
jgi:hypothetical protein